MGTSRGHYGAPAALLCADWTAPSVFGPFAYDCGGMVGTHVTVLLPGPNRILNLNEVQIEADTAPPAVPKVWPTWPEDATSVSVSRPLSLVGGERYWLRLECASFDAPCAVGTRILAPASSSPRSALLGSSLRRWQPRTTASCDAIDSGPGCCSSIGSDGDVCVPAVTAFASGAVCAGWNALQSSGDGAVSAACPYRHDPVTRSAQPRIKLGIGTPCHSLTDRVACCASIDGRTGSALHENAPCVPAVSAFGNGAVCESAGHDFSSEVELAQSVASCSELGGVDAAAAPLTTPFGEEARLSDEVQRLAFAQLSPIRHSQQITITRLDCSASDGTDCIGSPTRYSFRHQGHCSQGELRRSDLGHFALTDLEGCADECEANSLCGYFSFKPTNCILYKLANGCPNNNRYLTLTSYQLDDLDGPWPRPGTMRLRHNGQTTPSFSVKASAAAISNALRALPERTYVDANVTNIEYTNNTIVWTIELATHAIGCASVPSASPVFSRGDGGTAKVAMHAVVIAHESCLDGGLDLSIATGSGDGAPSVFLPSNATPETLTTALNELLGAKKVAEGVFVTRGNVDEFSPAVSFTITFLSGGAKPLLRAVSSARQPLLQRTFTADLSRANSTSTPAVVTVERIVPGGIDLLPIPGRYLSAPSDQPALRLRLSGQTTAKCAAPNWEALHLGCFGLNYTDPYAGQPGASRTFVGFSLERCALHCQRFAVGAVAFSAELDVCTCLSDVTLLAAQSARCTHSLLALILPPPHPRPTPPHPSLLLAPSLSSRWLESPLLLNFACTCLVHSYTQVKGLPRPPTAAPRVPPRLLARVVSCAATAHPTR